MKNTGVGLDAFAQPGDPDRSGQPVRCEVSFGRVYLVGRGGRAEGFQPRDRVPVRGMSGVFEQLEHLAFDGVAHHVLPTTGFIVGVFIRHPDDVDQ